MTQAPALTRAPTRADEAWRYAPATALAAVWPVAVEAIHLADGEAGALEIVAEGGAAMARLITLTLGAGAKFHLNLLLTGHSYGRIELRVALAEGAEFTCGAVLLAGAGQVLELVTEVTHQGPNATSRQVVRNVAGAQGAVTYLGKVCVPRGADGTDAEQSVRAMLLDASAQANARPELEIYADDVQCAHGCAVGALDAGALFYLAQRGLPPAQARALMLQAFVAEALVGAADAGRLQALVAARLGDML